MTVLLRSEVVLELNEADVVAGLSSVRFLGADILALEREKFEDMGSPSRVTVTIEPGDRLNEGDV